jgi:hypothetical protein
MQKDKPDWDRECVKCGHKWKDDGIIWCPWCEYVQRTEEEEDRPILHSFAEACQCVAAGGLAHRFGSEEGYYMTNGVLRRSSPTYWRDSVLSSYSGIDVSFSILEQASSDWILCHQIQDRDKSGGVSLGRDGT